MLRWIALVSLALLATGCAEEPPAGPEVPPRAIDSGGVVPEAPPDSTTVAAEDAGVETVFDAAAVVFDTTEPPQQPRVLIQEPITPQPRPRGPAPPPPPAPLPLPPPAPDPPVAGSCDVRATESYCFTYTGAAWSTGTAEDHCANAPEASFRAAECPVEGRIGTCVFRRGETPSREIVYTYYAPYDLGLARLACPGRFTED